LKDNTVHHPLGKAILETILILNVSLLDTAAMLFAFDLTTLTGTGSHSLYAFYGVLALGFFAAVSLGSIAFYNSKRPVGWEAKERPDYLPKIDTEEKS
jgi:hypothetical protein